MNGIDFQLGGGYAYQWQCGILLALNYFFDPVAYDPDLFKLITKKLGGVDEIMLEGKKKEDGTDLEDITVVKGNEQILIQVKTKEAKGEQWTLADPLLLKALYKFCENPSFLKDPDSTYFVFLTNRSFNKDLEALKTSINGGTLENSNIAEKLFQSLFKYAKRECKPAIKSNHFLQILSKTRFVFYLSEEKIRANIEAKLQSIGRSDCREAYAVLFDHFSTLSIQKGGGSITPIKTKEILNYRSCIDRDQRGIIAGRDVKDVNLINTGDVTGSYNTIMVGANNIINQVLAYSPIAKLDDEAKLATDRLREAIEIYARRYQKLQSQDVNEKHNPYKSLYSYDLVDAPYFYGRETAIYELLDKIHRSRLTVLFAESGSGKSSLINAGVASKLVAAGHFPVILRQYNEPPSEVIKQWFLPDVKKLPELKRFEKMSLRSFLDQVSQILGQSKLYLFLDQFEVFFQKLPYAQQIAFVNDLSESLRQPGPDLRCVLSLRKEYFGDLKIFEEQFPNIFANNYLLNAFTDNEAKDVIIEPARKQGVTYEPGLVMTIMQDLRQHQSASSKTSGAISSDQPPKRSLLEPPQIQLVCYTLFDEWRNKSKTPIITYKLYQEERGNQKGAKGILISHLSNVLKHMEKKEQKIALQILEALIDSEGNLDYKCKDDLLKEVKKTLQIKNLKKVEIVLESLVHSRLLRDYSNEKDEIIYYELAHSYLASQFELDLDTKTRKTAQDILNREVATWKNNNKLLIQEDKLNIIEAQRDNLVINEDANTLIELSKDNIAQRKKRTRGYVLTASSILVILVFAVFITGLSYIGAQGLANKAGSDLGTATAHLLVAEEQQKTADARLDEQVAAYDVASNELTEAKKQKDVVETAVAQSSQRIDELDRQAAAIELAIQAFGNTNQEQVLLNSIQAANITLDSGLETPWQTQRTLLKGIFDPPLFRVLEGNSRIVSIAFSPNADYVITGCEDSSVQIWEIKSGELVHILEGHSNPVWTMAFSHNGELLITGSGDGTARIWDITKGELIHILEGHSDAVSTVAVSFNGEFVVTGSEDETTRIWNSSTGQTVHVLEGRGVAVSFDGEFVVTEGYDLPTRIWNTETGQVVATIEQNYIYDAAFSRDGKYVITGREGVDGTAHLWDVESGELVHTLDGHSDYVWAMDFSQNGEYIVTGSRDGTARIWDVATGETVKTIEGHGFPITTVGFGKEEIHVATSGWDGSTRIWDVARGELLYMLPDTTIDLTNFVFSSDGEFLATRHQDGTVCIWAVTIWQMSQALEKHFGVRKIVGFSPDGKLMITESMGHALQVWELATGNLVQTLEGESVAISRDRKMVITGSEDGVAHIWEVATGKEVYILEGFSTNSVADTYMPSDEKVVRVNDNGNVSIWALETGESTMYTLAGYSSSDPVDGIAFSFDGKFLATGMGNNTYVWEVETGVMVHKFSSRLDSVAFSADGKFVATDQGGTLHIWDMSTGQLIYKLGESGSIGISLIKEIAFSPDGENVAFVTDEEDAAVKIWSLETGQLIRVLRGHGQVESLAFSSDWKYVMTGSSDDIVRIWSMEMGQLILSLDLWKNELDWFSDVAFSPNGEYVVTVRKNDGVYIWPFGTESLVEEAKRRIRPSLLDTLTVPYNQNP